MIYLFIGYSNMHVGKQIDESFDGDINLRTIFCGHGESNWIINVVRVS